MKKLFKKPKWLKPEINEAMYYAHVALLVGVVMLILKYIFGHDMLGLGWFLKLGAAVIIADIIAHTLFKLD